MSIVYSRYASYCATRRIYSQNQKLKNQKLATRRNLKKSLKAPLMRATRRSSQYNSSFAAPQSAFFAKTEARHKAEI
jgi:hypothetical protein